MEGRHSETKAVIRTRNLQKGGRSANYYIATHDIDIYVSIFGNVNTKGHRKL